MVIYPQVMAMSMEKIMGHRDIVTSRLVETRNACARRKKPGRCAISVPPKWIFEWGSKSSAIKLGVRDMEAETSCFWTVTFRIYVHAHMIGILVYDYYSIIIYIYIIIHMCVNMITCC